MRTLLTIIGAILLVFGLFFAAQGAGIIPYPKTSFMVDNAQWIYYGAGIAIVGAIVVLLARRGN